MILEEPCKTNPQNEMLLIIPLIHVRSVIHFSSMILLCNQVLFSQSRKLNYGKPNEHWNYPELADKATHTNLHVQKLQGVLLYVARCWEDLCESYNSCALLIHIHLVVSL